MDDIIEDLRRFNTPLRGVRCSADDDKNMPVGSVPAEKVKTTGRGKRPTAKSTAGDHTVQAAQTVNTSADSEPASVIISTSIPTALTLDKIADQIKPPMHVVSRQNIDSSLAISCECMHVHLYLLRDLAESQPKCPTCAVPTVARNVRAWVEEIISRPFTLVANKRDYRQYVCWKDSRNEAIPGGAETYGGDFYQLFTVRSGCEVKCAGAIVLPESRSRILIKDLTHRQLPGMGIVAASAQTVPTQSINILPNALPYSTAFSGAEFKYRICPDANLYIENCGWK